MTLITSTSNARIRDIRALRTRKAREQSGLCYVEGIRAVGEAVQAGADVETLVVAPRRLTSEFGQGLVAEAADRGVAVLEVTTDVFRTLSDREGPQGLAAVVRQRWVDLGAVRLRPGDRWVALDQVADPGNLGTILRTCDATGAGGVVLVGACTDPYDPAAVRAGMGAVFSRHVARASFEDLVAWTGLTGAQLVGSSAGGATDYREADYGDPTVLLLGSEREGLSLAQRAECDEVVRMPMLGRASSLNLAVAAGVLLYEVLLRRERPGAARP
jgi:TrmH family RNA methyltransferase